MGTDILEHVESVQEEAVETLTEFEYHLLSHPEYERDTRLYVDTAPPDRRPEEAERLIEQSMEQTVKLYGEIEGLEEELNGSSSRGQTVVERLESKAAELVTEATKLIEDPSYQEWALKNAVGHNFKITVNNMDYTTKREETEGK